MQIIISGKGLPLTGAIESYVTKKLAGLEKFFKDIVRADVVVGEETRHHVKHDDKFFAECKLEVPGYDVFHRSFGTGLYEAVDLLKDHLEMELKKYKNKLRAGKKQAQKSVRKSKEYNPE